MRGRAIETYGTKHCGSYGKHTTSRSIFQMIRTRRVKRSSSVGKEGKIKGAIKYEQEITIHHNT